MKFPKRLYVVQEEDWDNTFFVAHKDVSAIEDKQPVAIYELVDVQHLVIDRHLAGKAKK